MKLADILYVIVRRWRYKKKYYVRIIINIAIGLCVYNTIFNLGININQYIKNHFFSNNELKEVLIEGNDQRVDKDLPCLQDNAVKDYRGIIDYKVLVDRIEGNYDEDFTTFDITIIDAYDDLFFDGEYQVEHWNGTSIWKNGVMINHKYAELLGEEVIGRQVEFRYDGEKYRVPIVGVVDAALCENIAVECQAGMYISVDCLKKEFSDYACVEIQLCDYKDVKEFEKRYQNNKYRIISQSEEAEHAMHISKTIDLIIILLVIIFLAYSTIGIHNAVQALLEEKINSVTLYRIIGFSDKNIYSIELSEALILGSVGGIIGNIFSVLLLAFISKSGYLNFSEIHSEILFAYNWSTIYMGMALSIFITMLSSKRVLKNHMKQEIITCIKSE